MPIVLAHLGPTAALNFGDTQESSSSSSGSGGGLHVGPAVMNWCSIIRKRKNYNIHSHRTGDRVVILVGRGGLVRQHGGRARRSVQQLEEFSGGQVGLPEDRTQGAALYGAALGDDHHPPVGATVDSMAALRAHVTKTDGFQDTSHLTDRQVRQGWAHAAPGSWNEVTRGVLET